MSESPLTDVRVRLLIPRALFDDDTLAATQPWTRSARACARRRAKDAGQVLAEDAPHWQSFGFVRPRGDDWQVVQFEDCEAVLYEAVYACEPPT